MGDDEAAAPAWSSSGTTTDPEDEDDDEQPRRLHPYTLLHLLVLSAVAFVLGFLIMLLYIQTRGTAATDEAAAVLSWVVGRAGPL